MLLLIDSYDSFTFNVVQGFESLGASIEVRRNDAPADELLALRPDAVILGPGPGHPADPRAVGVLPELLAQLDPAVPLLGICLGHQALVLACGGAVATDARPVHGRASAVHHDGTGLFEGLPSPFEAARYHSIHALEIPAALRVTARTHGAEGLEESEGELVMAVEHVSRPWFGVQFHPESVLTPAGPTLLASFLRLAGAAPRA